MNNQTTRIWTTLRYLAVIPLIALGILSILATGGGGGGGGGGGPIPPVYTGLTTQAIIESSNATNLAAGALLIGGAATSTSVTSASVAATQSSGPPLSVKPHPTIAARALKRALWHVGFIPAGRFMPLATVRDSGTVLGPCGGSFNFDILIDDVTGDFSGTLTFNSYCEAGDILSGSTTFSGRIDLVTLDFISISLSISVLSITTSGGDTFTISGTIDFTDIAPAPGSGETVTMTANTRDAAGIVYRHENFRFTSSIDPGGIERIANITGRFFWPTEGYVDADSAVDFLFASNPHAGQLHIVGAIVPPSSANGQALLTANADAATFVVQIDEDGDDIYEATAPPPVCWELVFGGGADDVWDLCQGAVVTASSPVIGGSDIRNIFGGSFGTVEPDSTLFQDNQPIGTVHFVEWQTPALVTVSNFILLANHDADATQRGFSRFTLLAKNPGTGFFETLFEFFPSNPYSDTPCNLDPGTFLLVSVNVTPTLAQDFRAEFEQFGSSSGTSGPRIRELDGFEDADPGACNP